MGKPVILGSHAYYDSLGFAHPAVDRADYFQRVEEALAGGLIPNETQREAAALCLYLILKCRSVYTSFTPQPKDFEQWLQESPAQWWARPELEDLAAALITREPLTWLRHLRLSACVS